MSALPKLAVFQCDCIENKKNHNLTCALHHLHHHHSVRSLDRNLASLSYLPCINSAASHFRSSPTMAFRSRPSRTSRRSSMIELYSLPSPADSSRSADGDESTEESKKSDCPPRRGSIIGASVSKLTNLLGMESFWQSPLDMECQKAARILRSLCSTSFFFLFFLFVSIPMANLKNGQFLTSPSYPNS